MSLQVANTFYTDISGDWEVLVLDASKLTSEVKFEEAADVGSKPAGELSGNAEKPALFPHLYGPIESVALIERLPVERSQEGQFLRVLT
jgi:uncharacterized protein (DUF952 family)